MDNNLFSTLVGPLCGGIFFLVFGALGVWLVITSRKQSQKAAASQGWPSAVAQITLSGVRQGRSHDSEGDLQISYYPYVQYTYQVAGTSYQGDKITFGARKTYSSSAKAAAELARYSLGAQVRVFYNPENPSEAVLEQRAVGSNFMLIFGILALLIALCSVCLVIWSLISNFVSS